MLPFGHLPRMIVVHLMTMVVFYINDFVWNRGVSQILTPLTIVEGNVLDFHLHFRVIYGEFVQTFEGSDNTMAPRTVDAIMMGPTGNLQGGVRCLSFEKGKVLNRQWNDVQNLKMPISAISRINFMAKKQKAVKGLKFGDHQNIIDHLISTVVDHDSAWYENQGTGHADKVIQHDIEIEEAGNNNDPGESEDANSVEDPKKTAEEATVGDTAHDEHDADNESYEGDNNDKSSQDNNEILVENQSEEIAPPGAKDDEIGITVTRSGRVSRPYDYEKHFPETAHYQDSQGYKPGQWAKPYYYYEEDMVEKIGRGLYYSDFYFTEDVSSTESALHMSDSSA